MLAMLAPCHAVNRVFLLGGQSNMVGQGINAELVSPYNATQYDVSYWYGAWGWTHLRPGFGNGGSNFGPEVAFGRAIKDALPGDTIYLVKYAVNGTALFNDWKPITGSQYIGFMNTVNAALAHLDNNGIDYEISGMLWMQGESDAYEGQAAGYETNLRNFISVMRTELGTPEMPFIIARVLDYYGGTLPPLVGSQTDPTQADIVRAAQVAVAESTPYVGWFDSDNYQVANPISNPGHYGTQGQLDLGNDFATANLAYIPSVKIEMVDSNMVLRWNSMPGATYTVRRNGDLAAESPSWLLVVGGIPASPPENSITLPLPAASAMFYIVGSP